MERFVVEGIAADEALELGLDWLAEHGLAGEETAVLLGNLDAISNLKGAVGPERAAAAKADRKFRHGGAVLRVFTEKTRPRSFRGALLVPWASEEFLTKAEAMGPAALCATGWSQGELDPWKGAFGVTDLRSGDPVGAAREAPAPIRGLVISLDDVLHPTDKTRAITNLVAIREEGFELDPVVVRAAALKVGWNQRAADRLFERTEKVAAGNSRGGERLGRKAQRERVALLTKFADEAA